MTLGNKVIVITGASSGLGEQIAYKTAEEGAKLALISRTKKNLEKVKYSLKEK